MNQQRKDYLLLEDADNTVTVLRDLKSGLKLSIPSVEGDKIIVLKQDIPFAHKFARTHIPKGGVVIKYGEVIGIATIEISPGDYVHTHNIESTRARVDPR